MAQLRDRFGFKHDDLARKFGRSRSSITETLSLSSIPQDIRQLCDEAGITSRSTLLQLARLNDEDDMRRMLAAIKAGDVRSRDDARRMAKGEDTDPHADASSGSPAGSPSGYTFRVRRPDRNWSMTLKFGDRQDVPADEIIATLQGIIRELRKQP